MFNFLSSKIESVFTLLGKKGVITEEDLDKALREIRITFLEADVALPVAKQFFEEVKKEAEGQKVYKSVSPKQMIIKIIHDKLTSLLSQSEKETELSLKGSLATYLMVGLQGVGKTTTAAKVAYYLNNKLNQKTLLVSLDLQRAAAYNQLQALAQNNSLGFYSFNKEDFSGNGAVIEIAKKAKEHAKANNYSVVIFDTAGRLNIDNELMHELKELSANITPNEILLVADSLIGQASVNMAKDFNSSLPLTGVILTKVDGDARGGAALSIKYVTGIPIKFMGVGESITSLEAFNAKRIADRILQMGDVVTLVEKALELDQDEEVKGLSKRLSKGIFTMDDLKKQFEQMLKLGGIGSMMGFIPGLGKLRNKITESGIDDTIIKKQIAIVNSMTKLERKNPKIINGSRRKRIANGAGVTVEKVNKLLKQYEQTAKILKQFNKGGLKSLTELTKLNNNFSL